MSVAWILALALFPDVSQGYPATAEDRLAAALIERLTAAVDERILLNIKDLKLVQALPALVLMNLEGKVGAKLERLQPYLQGPPDSNKLFEALIDACSNFSRMRGGRMLQRGCAPGSDPAFWQALNWLDHPNPAVSYFAAAWMIRLRIPNELFRIRGMIERAPLTSYPWLRPLVREARRSWSDDLIRNGLKEGDLWSVAAAASSRDPKWTEALIRLARDPKRYDRADLVWAIGELRSRETVNFLRSELKGDECAGEAAEALGKIGDASVVPDLVKTLQGTNGVWLQARLIWALGELGTENELPLLKRFAESTEYTGVVNVSGAARHAIASISRRIK